MASAATAAEKTTKVINKKPKVAVEIPKMEIKTMLLSVVSDEPLIMHRWSEKAKKEMLDKQMKKAKGPKEPKDPPMDYAESVYIIDEDPGDRVRLAAQYRDGGVVGEGIEGIVFGFPSVAFKATAVGACRFGDTKMTEARGAFHVSGIGGDLVKIEGTPPIMREDMVRIGQGTADLRYRGEFKKWRATFSVRYNSGALSVEQIVNLFNTAGFGVGVGEWRPEKNGQFGMFHVAAN